MHPPFLKVRKETIRELKKKKPYVTKDSRSISPEENLPKEATSYKSDFHGQRKARVSRPQTIVSF